MRDPTPEELAELQDPDTWDWESVQRGAPNPDAGAVVGVRMASADFREIIQAARAAGMTLETFMREASLAWARQGAPSRTP